MIRKDVIIAIFATFCLTTPLFAILPTRSGTNAGDYDSWADINEDGKINMYDIGYTAQRFGTAGDSTKNVNVTNPGYEILDLGTLNMTSDFDPSIPYSKSLPTYGTYAFCGGYSRMTIMLRLAEFSGPDTPPFRVTLACILWSTGHAVALEYLGNTTSIELLWTEGHGYQTAVPKPSIIETRAPYFELGFNRYSSDQNWTGWVLLDVHVYLRNE